MRKYGKWALTLGLIAATPSLGSADPWSRTDQGSQPSKAAAEAKSSSRTQNQKKADEIAAALGKARLQGYDIEIEYRDGVATLKGRVVDPKQKDKATKIVEGVAGVNRCDNQLILSPKPSLSQRMSDRGGVMQASQSDAGGPAPRGVVQASHAASRPQSERVQQVNYQPAEGAPAGGNQAAAEQIAAALTAAHLDGYDIEIRYQNGVAVLSGTVETLAQRQAAERVCSQVPGVQSVSNQLRPTREAMPPGPAGGPVQPVAYQGQPGQPGPMGPGMAMPVGYGHPGAGAAQAVYNMPYVPDYAWPSYAQYPNSAAVNYPQQYSASAWPYIGPFYPYPQVPLGWRDATLRWDDGYWNLQFRQRTDKWWWFLKPSNW